MIEEKNAFSVAYADVICVLVPLTSPVRRSEKKKLIYAFSVAASNIQHTLRTNHVKELLNVIIFYFIQFFFFIHNLFVFMHVIQLYLCTSITRYEIHTYIICVSILGSAPERQRIGNVRKKIWINYMRIWDNWKGTRELKRKKNNINNNRTLYIVIRCISIRQCIRHTCIWKQTHTHNWWETQKYDSIENNSG